MRLDKFLKLSHLIKRRSLAKEICERGLVKLNSQVAKAGKEVKEGDRLAIEMGNRSLLIEIREIPNSGLKKTESLYYRIIEERIKSSD